METRTLKLTDNWINYLINLPESGMGYHVVKVVIKGGKVLTKHKVLNSSILILEGDEKIKVSDIEKIELEK